MSWNAHTDHVFNQFPGQLTTLALMGPDGSAWGVSGKNSITPGSAVANPKSGQSVTLEGNKKYMFLRNVDNSFAYNCKGQGLGVLKGSQYVAAALAAEGYKVEQCLSALEKLKNYLSGIGYN